MTKPKARLKKLGKMAREFWLHKDAGGTADPDYQSLKPSECVDEYIHVIEYSAYANLKKIIAEEISENDEFGSEFVIAGILRAENQKLKQLILLTDPAVSNVEMNTLSAKQWSEFLRWQEAEGYNACN